MTRTATFKLAPEQWSTDPNTGQREQSYPPGGGTCRDHAGAQTRIVLTDVTGLPVCPACAPRLIRDGEVVLRNPGAVEAALADLPETEEATVAPTSDGLHIDPQARRSAVTVTSRHTPTIGQLRELLRSYGVARAPEAVDQLEAALAGSGADRIRALLERP